MIKIKLRKNPNDYNIFLDDERFPSDKDTKNYIIIRNYNDFINIINKLGIPKFISFDHDLGEDKNGKDCANYLINYILDNDLKPDFDFVVHSQNPVGAKNISNLLNQFKKLYK